MKFAILTFALFVLLACHEVSCFEGAARVSGNCRPGDLPLSVRTRCGDVTCTRDSRGYVSWNLIGCTTTYCPYSRERRIEEDLTKVYPDCCAKVECMPYDRRSLRSRK